MVGDHAESNEGFSKGLFVNVLDAHDFAVYFHRGIELGSKSIELSLLLRFENCALAQITNRRGSSFAAQGCKESIYLRLWFRACSEQV